MDVGGVSMPDSPILESGLLSPTVNDQSVLEKQREDLQTYLDSVPYKCESAEEMQAKFEHIIGKIYICAKTCDWLALTSWDGLLSCWFLMRYPIAKPTRAKLARLYYELCLVPGVEPRIIRSWVDMISRLLPSKPRMRRKLEAHDLQLPWKPLWRALQKELWPKKRIQETSRNVVNILLFLAEQSKHYYPANEIPEMLSSFLPLLTKDSVLTMIPVLTSFLPLNGAHLYLPALFKIWEAFNSTVIDDRLLELAGDLSEEHVAGKAGISGEDGVHWRDVGIWSSQEWTMLMGKCLGSMNVPVGATKGASTTAGQADVFGDKNSLRIKKTVSRYSCLAKLIVYSMSLDGPLRDDISDDGNASRVQQASTQQVGYLAGSKALDSLDKLITSIESYFHPSNSGSWSMNLSSFLQCLTVEFNKRWQEEEDYQCKTPITQRLTPAIKRAFVITLRTPTLLAMFAKDRISMGLAQSALRSMALLQPQLVMPQLLERAYGGLEVVNETHRTTAVLSMLSGVTLPLVSEKMWLGGQKNLVPLLELCLPGVDLNDPIKTVCATMFISAAVQHIKIGDLSIHSQSTGALAADDAPFGEVMDVVAEESRIPDGVEIWASDAHPLDKAEERSLVRDSTAGFADWVVSFFRRVFALYENLPEEGGKKNTTGGKQEEGVLKMIKTTLDIVCLHLSDVLFELVLKVVYEYATTNAKSNSVRAFGQLVSCLARAKPQLTVDKFLPFCVEQIEEELRHGASSIQTTSTHTAVPSDTTLHWNLSILRGCLGHGGPHLLKHKDIILNLLRVLINKTKSERGYSSVGHLITRILSTISGVYPLNSRFINSDEWNTPEFDRNHNLHWGRLYAAKDVKVEWHVPSDDEILFIMEILDHVTAPALHRVETLLQTTNTWDSTARNDFCRYLQVVRSSWAGLPTLYIEGMKEVVNPCLAETDTPELIPTHLDVKAGFTLTDPQDPRYQAVVAHRLHFGRVLHSAAQALRENNGGEDHIDAIIGVTKGIDVYLLEHAMTRSNYMTMQKNYTNTRGLNRVSVRQKENSRLTLLKRALMYHSGRVYMHALYRRRSELDDSLIDDLVELSLSPYTRVRCYGQSVLHAVCGYYVRSTRFILPKIISALAKRSDPDRMKGALHILWNKGVATYALSDRDYRGHYIISLLECQHQEKPSVQKLVTNVQNDCLVNLTEEAAQTDSAISQNQRVIEALNVLQTEFSSALVEEKTIAEASRKILARINQKNENYDQLLLTVIQIARRSTTHWRYTQMATRFLWCLLRRDVAPTADLAKFFIENTVNPHPTIRNYAQRGITKILTFVKIRTYSKNVEELWLAEWTNPMQRTLTIDDPEKFMAMLHRPLISECDRPELLVDKIPTGFLVWGQSVKAYQPPEKFRSFISWENSSGPALRALEVEMSRVFYFTDLATLWAQESNSKVGSTADLELRMENVTYIKTIAKMFEDRQLQEILNVIEPLWSDTDRYKQRAAAEIIAGLLRGSKHWPTSASEKLWSWFTERLQRIFAQMKPDTIGFWETLFSTQLHQRDPRRNQTLINWFLELPLDFHSDSAFTMSKSLGLFGTLVDALGVRFDALSDKYVNLFFDNAHTGYAEIRAHIAGDLNIMLGCQWHPSYPSVEAFMLACQEKEDPLHIRDPRYVGRIQDFVNKLPIWKVERLPPPRVNQSQYDKVGLSLLQLFWTASHGPQAPLIFPYVIPILPEFLEMSELSDSSELQKYSSAVLYVLSAVTPPQEFIELVADGFISTIKSSSSWRIRLNGLPILIVFFYRNLTSFSDNCVNRLMDLVLTCLADENVEVREMAAKALSGLLRCSQRKRILPLKSRFIAQVRKIRLPARQDPSYAECLRVLHSAILGLCALFESFPYSIESWMPALTEVLAPHASDPPPISTTIRKCASEFKKTHQDTWHTDQQAFDEDQLQSLSNMLIGTSYYA